MQIQISTRHGSISDQTQEVIRSKVDKLNRVFERLTSIELTVDLEKADHPKVDLQVSAEHKHNFIAEYSSEDLFGSVDQVVHKVEQQLRKYKGKIQDHHIPSPAVSGEIE
ncbi:MAG: ribosome hibernation-promoting factor, HPF/YfiA family [Thermoguttaceae bacterium]